MTACEGQTGPPKRRLLGATGLIRIDDRHVPSWFEALCHAGMPHHMSIFDGHHADRLRRLARQTAIRWQEFVT